MLRNSLCCASLLLLTAAAGAQTRPAATTRPTGPVDITVSGLPVELRTAQPCKPTFEFKNTLQLPVSLKTLKGHPNLHVKAWRNGEIMKLTAMSPSDGEVVLKPGESTSVELDFAALGLTRQAGRYLVSIDVVTFLVDEATDKPLHVPLTVATKLQFAVREAPTK